MAVLGEAQRGRVAREQLLEVGMTPPMIKRDLRTSALHFEHPGVYVVGAAAALPLGPEIGALLAVHRPVALAQDSAALVLRLGMPAPRDVHVVVPRTHTKRSRSGIVVHRSSTLDRRDITSVHGLPVTTAERTLFDLVEGGRHDELTVEHAFDEALHRRLISRTKVRELAARLPNRQGTQVLLALADPARAQGATKSELERRMWGILRAANLDEPERNYRVEVFTIDLYWPRARYGLEVDSWQWHAGPWAFNRDRRKSARMRDLGIELDRVTAEMIDDPIPLVARIVRALTERTAGEGRAA